VKRPAAAARPAGRALARRVAVLLGVLPLAGAGCATSPPPADAGPMPPAPDRRDYARFAAAYPDLLEPNYLPFMVHRLDDPDGGDDVLAFCRWSREDMPLSVHVATPEIPEALQNEFRPRDPQVYVRAVHRALRRWERSLEGLVRFRSVDTPEDARLAIALLGEQAIEDEEASVRVLGMADLGRSCRAGSWHPDAERLHVDFRVDALRIFVADRFGLLAEDQVEWIALHEIGHALGMRRHSPIPADLMYEVVRDRLLVTEGLSTEDVNSFLNLYRLPNGTVYGRVRGREPRPEPLPPSGEPVLTLAPYVDSTLGFSLRTPLGWMRIDTGKGMVAVDGVSWDYSASFQVVIERFSTIEEYLERFGAHHARRSRILQSARLTLEGRPTLQLLLLSRREPRMEEVTLIEAGDGRLVVVIADGPASHFHAYLPWFRAALETLDIWDSPGS